MENVNFDFENDEDYNNMDKIPYYKTIKEYKKENENKTMTYKEKLEAEMDKRRNDYYNSSKFYDDIENYYEMHGENGNK